MSDDYDVVALTLANLADKVERLTVERDAAYISIESLRNALAEQDYELDTARDDVLRLTAECDAARAETKRLIDRLAWAEARVDEDAETGRIAAERDAACAEVERLRANGQETRDSSRPTDEDLWREGFKRQVAEYRKQWGWSR